MAGKCIFNNAWLEMPAYKMWLQRNVSDVHSARCTICYKNFSVASMGKSAVKSHAKSRKHIDLQSTRRTSMNVVRSYSNDKNTPESICKPQDSPSLFAASSTSNIGNIESHVVKNDVLAAEILWTLKTLKNHGSYKANEDIEKMFNRMFPDSAIVSKFSCREKKPAYYAAYGIAPYLENLLQENLNTKNFVLFDESLNIMRQEKQMDVHVRYWHQNRVSTIYFNSVFLGHSRSSDIFEEFISTIAKLKFSKTIQILMDRPNVNWKF
ncbi:hypothetical protein AVEN_39220-1 [Araneus ventricosus]|uniref:Uncharacterized protein n=1 Tax=Araneus ventricosus TaxID=182803 RepID=A0A4Y2I9Q7_ARAVE|nr:hypothetical protein AVEN_39220-1 [Araneus ventricosus]